MYVNLDKEFIERTKLKANKEAISEMGEDGKNCLLYAELQEKIESIEITENEIIIDVDTELGYFSLSIPIDTEFLEQLLSVVVKKMNKIKTLLETLK
ncbi:MAG: hypothetical protein ACTSUF_03355 [Candidatus Heimdallarchaeaceae archaeon]